MKEKYKCAICGKEVTANNSYIGSHVKRVHHLTLYEYFSEYEKDFTNIRPEFEIEKCAFCDLDAIPNLTIDYKNKTYYRSYDGYSCQNIECLNKRSIEYLGVPLNQGIKFDRIACVLEYGAKLKKISLDDQKHIRSRGWRENGLVCNLEGFIEKYGKIDGPLKYKERNRKVGYGSSIQYYIEKYGEVEGPERYNNKINRGIYSGSLKGYIEKHGEKEGTEKWYEVQASKRSWSHNIGPSKSSLIIKELLDKCGIEYEMEYKVRHKNGLSFVDYYLPDLNVIIEFYGDYWHGNPKIFKGSDILRQTNCTYDQIWENDKIRLDSIKNNFINMSALIIWESHKITEDVLMQTLDQLIGKDLTIELN